MEVNVSSSAQWPTHVRAIVGGSPGTGKTSLGLTFPKPFYVFCGEPDPVLSKTPGVSYAVIESEPDLLQIKEAVESGKFDTVVFDTVDRLQRTLLQRKISSENRSEIEMSDWGWIATRMRAIFGAFKSLPVNLLLLCNTNSETGGLAIQGQFRDGIHEYADFAFRSEIGADDVDVDALLCDGADPSDYTKIFFLSNRDDWTHSLVDSMFMNDLHQAFYQDIYCLLRDGGEQIAVSERKESVITDMDEAKTILAELFPEQFEQAAEE